MHAQLLNMAYTVSKLNAPVRIWICEDCVEHAVDVEFEKDLEGEHLCMECGEMKKVGLYKKLKGGIDGL